LWSKNTKGKAKSLTFKLKQTKVIKNKMVKKSDFTLYHTVASKIAE